MVPPVRSRTAACGNARKRKGLTRHARAWLDPEAGDLGLERVRVTVGDLAFQHEAEEGAKRLLAEVEGVEGQRVILHGVLPVPERSFEGEALADVLDHSAVGGQAERAA